MFQEQVGIEANYRVLNFSDAFVLQKLVISTQVFL